MQRGQGRRHLPGLEPIGRRAWPRAGRRQNTQAPITAERGMARKGLPLSLSVRFFILVDRNADAHAQAASPPRQRNPQPDFSVSGTASSAQAVSKPASRTRAAQRLTAERFQRRLPLTCAFGSGSLRAERIARRSVGSRRPSRRPKVGGADRTTGRHLLEGHEAEAAERFEDYSSRAVETTRQRRKEEGIASALERLRASPSPRSGRQGREMIAVSRRPGP